MLPAENEPTLGLLAGRTSVYCAQKAPAGQELADSTVTIGVEFCEAVFSRGMVIFRLPPETGTDWKELKVASILAPVMVGEVPMTAVTKPWIVPGPVAVPVSATSGMLPKAVPPGTFRAKVALYATPPLMASTTTSNTAPTGNGQKLKLPFASVRACMEMRSIPTLSNFSSATWAPAIGSSVLLSTTLPLRPVVLVLI